MKLRTFQQRLLQCRGGMSAAATAALLTALNIVPVASAQIAFTDASNDAGIAHFAETYGAAVGDLNSDGYPDIFASNHRTQPSLFLNMGDGTFVETGPQALTWQNRPGADTHGGTWADFDNDGDQDLVVSTGTNNLSQFLVNYGGRLVEETIQRGLTATNIGGRLPVWLDYNGDGRTDFVMTQYGGVAKVFGHNADGTFTDVTTSDAKIVCKRFHYGQLYDLNGDGVLDFLCPAESVFPQKVFDPSTLPWTKLFDSAAPTAEFPTVEKVPDSIVGDFNNDGRMDIFLLSNVQLRPSSVVQGGPTHFEANLTGGTKGFKFVSSGLVSIATDWNKVEEGRITDLAKIKIGAGGVSPLAIPFTLDPADPNVVGMPPAPVVQSELPVMQIGFDSAAQRWTVVVVTKLAPNSTNVFSEAYFEVDSTTAITNLVSTGLWPSDKTGRPTLLMNYPIGLVDATVAAGLATPIQCVSATAGDYDNDSDLDLYLACRTGASNIPNILYANQGDGTFVAVPSAGGAQGPVGIAMASGAGTADSAVTLDYDVDGFLDLFVTNGLNLRPLNGGGQNSLFRNQGNANHWIQIDLVGTQSDRDAVGARVYATANGLTQLRVQDGGYHRWSQDSRRSHFGLAGSETVDLRVEWPSGAVETFDGVAADALYRVTEGEGIAPVALGVAPAYPCGPPPLDGTVDAGVFIWRDCPSGEWRMKTASGGGSQTYGGRITSSANFVSVNPIGLNAGDVLDSTTDPKQIVFTFQTVGSSLDGVNFVVANGESACLKIDLPAGIEVFYGPFRAQLAQPVDLDTQAACAGLPPELSVAPVAAGETAGQMDFVVTLNPASDQPVTVNYATTGGTATAGLDFTAVADVLTFDPGQSSRLISVPILDDALAEGSEAFTLTLSDPQNAVLSLASVAVGTINDDEVSPCGTPSYNAGQVAAAFVWKNCATGLWSARFTAGGSPTTITYVGNVSADAPFTIVQPFSLEATDVLDSTTDPSVISFVMKMNTTGQDGFNFTLPGGAAACFGISAPAGAQALLGAGKTPVALPFRLDTLGPC